MKQPKDDSFESAWQEAFDKASLAPPDIIWKNIESTLPTEGLGVKPSAEGLATSSKLIIGAGIILISGLSYFYINDSSSNNYSKKLNQISNEKNITKPNEPTGLDSKTEIENMVTSPTFVAKKHFVPEIKKQNLPTEIKVEEAPNEPEIAPIETISSAKIEEKVFEMQPKGFKMPKITIDTPDLITNTDSQLVVPNTYYELNAVPIQKNKKGIFRNFKITGGIRMSN